MKTANAKSEPFALSRISSPAIRRRKFAARLVAITREVFKLEPYVSVTEWAEQNRYLSDTGAETGRYRAERCPYQAAIQDAFADSRVREISWQAGERIGKTTVGANVLGYIIDRAPSSVLWVMPSRESMADLLKDEIEPMIAASARLRKKVAAGKTGKGKTNNIRRKTFAGGVVTFVGGGSSAPLAFRTVKIVILDEVDKLKALPEGDADSLASKRVSTFGTGFKILRFSKPTEEGSSKINRHYLRGSQSKYFLLCPGCGEFQEPGWALLRFDDVKMRCTHCNSFFDQDSWLEGAGQWQETRENREHKSFQCSALISPYIRWQTLIGEYREAVHALEAGDNSLIRVFENSRLGQVFSGKVEKIEAQDLYNRREYFGEADIPEGTIACSLGIDSQADRFYWLLIAWGRKMEAWLCATGSIVGDMRAPEPWAELQRLLGTIWLDKDGNGYRHVLAAMDVQGEYYSEALAFVRSNAWRGRLRAVRGWGDQLKRGGLTGIGILRNRYTDKNTSVTVTNLDVNAAKTQLATMLGKVEPAVQVHIPAGLNGEDVRGFDLETISEFTAEYRRPIQKAGYTYHVWHKRPTRPNHRLDCAVYALAALAMTRLNIDVSAPQRTEARNIKAQETGEGRASTPERRLPYQRPREVWGTL